MSDLILCRACGGRGDVMRNISEDGEYDLDACYSCGGLGFETIFGNEPQRVTQSVEQSGRKRAKIIADALRVIDEVKSKGGKK